MGVRGSAAPTGTRRTSPPVDVSRVARNAIDRERLRRGVVECPLCRRQIPSPTDHLLVYGAAERVTADTADAVTCPACDGVTFVVDGSDAE